MKNYIPIFWVKFKNEISPYEIPFFRGAVLNAVGKEGGVLFHNHKEGDSFRYSYPFIQYKRVHKKAFIFCVSEGVDAIGHFLALRNFSIMLGERPVQLEIETVSPKSNLVQTWKSTFRYRLRNWLPLNSENYVKYKNLDECSARIAFLENILIGNLLSFAKGLDIMIEDEIVCKLLYVDEPHIVKVKDVKMMAFNAEFKTNLSLPDYMGIGKHVSIGYGTVVKVYIDNNEK